MNLNELETLLNTNITYNIPHNLRIRENISLNKCIDNFFYKYKRIVLKYKDYLNSKKSLPYKKIKRFVFTAYNNLIEIDMHINDAKLLNTKNALEELEEYFYMIHKDIKNPAVIMLEKIFLNKQSDYKKINDRFENNKKIIDSNLSKAKSLENNIKTLEKELLVIKNKKSDEYLLKEQELKNNKKTYVDLIDEAQNLKDENKILIDDLTAFREFYANLFKKFFIEKSEILLDFINKELNSITYEFDVLLWDNAKKSKAIKHFFDTAEIEGSYSTKTFMKYYLKNLNKEKMNEKDSELLEVYKSLDVFNKNILVFDRKRDRAKDIISFLENIDHDISAKSIHELKDLILYIKENGENIDYLVLEIEKDIEHIIHKIISILRGLHIDIILYSQNIKKENIVEYNNLFSYLETII